MNFILYLASYASSLIVFIKIPSSASISFLQYYSVANILGSLSITMLLTNGIGVNIQKAFFYLAIFAVFCLNFLGVKFVYLSYPIALLVSDYLISQTQSSNVIKYYRIFIAFAAITFFFDIDFVTQIKIRNIILISSALYCLVKSTIIRSLEIKSSILYLFIIYCSYSGVLFCVARLPMLPDEVKYWYIATQIGLALQLKLMDYSSRVKNPLDTRMQTLINLLIFGVLVLVLIFYFNIIPFFLYLFGWAGLYMAKRRFLNEYSL